MIYRLSIFLIEWGEKIMDILPNNVLKLSMNYNNHSRTLKLEGNRKWEIRLKELIDNEKKQTIN